VKGGSVLSLKSLGQNNEVELETTLKVITVEKDATKGGLGTPRKGKERLISCPDARSDGGDQI